ncbi:MAG: DUF1648 domain-containing protein [Candidatus Pacebacteria bacterium]|nr:DUF1648 domain-containing protein [Candidatus Paceibacterota bacterium]
MKKTQIIVLIILAISIMVSLYLYPIMPENMASHWNIYGDADGYMSKFWGVFLFPILMVVFTLLFFFIPNIDPEKKNIKKFEGDFNVFVIVFNLFMLYIYALTIAWNMGQAFDMTQAIMPGFAALFYFVGVLLGKAKQNYMIGIRTPWTLANEGVWDKTHKKGEYLFKAIAIFALLGAICPDFAWALFFIPLIGSIIYLCFYSYIEYRKIK